MIFPFTLSTTYLSSTNLNETSHAISSGIQEIAPKTVIISATPETIILCIVSLITMGFGVIFAVRAKKQKDKKKSSKPIKNEVADLSKLEGIFNECCKNISNLIYNGKASDGQKLFICSKCNRVFFDNSERMKK